MGTTRNWTKSEMMVIEAIPNVEIPIWKRRHYVYVYATLQRTAKSNWKPNLRVKILPGVRPPWNGTLMRSFAERIKQE